ncbi:hypothetical protein CF319_g8499 [Tilletia indica]|nr:hypothetical protein CF319_g8499 [Tilletia indica]
MSAPSSSSSPGRPASAATHARASTITALTAAQLQAEAIAIRKRLCAVHLDKTKSDYESYLNEYERYCNDRQPPIAPYPITAPKTALFLDFCMKREHYVSGRKGDSSEEKKTIAGTQLGLSAIKQRINALEWFRKANEDEWCEHAEYAETRVKLRDNATISQLETAVRRDKRNRANAGQEQKAMGSSSATLKKDEVTRLSEWALKEGRTPAKIGTQMRDRSMLLACLGTAFRGDSLRRLEWSDLFVHQAIVPSRGDAAPVKLLALRADNSKTNQHGRLDEFAIARHRDPLHCSVGGMAMQALWSLQLGNQERPSFEPNFNSQKHGRYGFREWWAWKVFRGRHAAATQEMSYKTHDLAVRKMFSANDVDVGKTTHAGRAAGAMNARENGASVAGTKALGGWSDGGAFRSCYDRSFPLDAIWAVAGFNGSDLDSYHVPRAQTKPPQALLDQLFPWLEEERDKLKERRASNENAVDFALSAFLGCLEWFREVLLQDAAALSQHPSWSDFHFFAACPVFSSPAFHEFAAELNRSVKEINSESERQLAQLPQHLGAGVRLALVDIRVDAERQAEEIHKKLDICLQQLQGFQLLLQHARILTSDEVIDPALLVDDAYTRQIVRTTDTTTVTRTSTSNPITSSSPIPTPSQAPPQATPPAPLPFDLQLAPPPPHSPTQSLPFPTALPPFPSVTSSSTAAVESDADAAQLRQQRVSALKVEAVERWGKAQMDSNEPWRYDASKDRLFPSYQFKPSPSVRDV